MLFFERLNYIFKSDLWMPHKQNQKSVFKTCGMMIFIMVPRKMQPHAGIVYVFYAPRWRERPARAPLITLLPKSSI
jgi:hypothetical protein